MKVAIVLAHPENQSFNGHLARVAETTFRENGHEVETSDLYGADFDPRESHRHFSVRRHLDRFDPQSEQRFSWDHHALPNDVKREMDRILWADIVILQFPLWWFGMPAILKGWMDRVFVYGGLYSGSQRHDKGPCRGKQALMSVTTGSSEAACSFSGREGDTRLMLWPCLYSLRYLGFSVIEPFVLHGVRGGLEGEAAASLRQHLSEKEQEYTSLLRNIESAPLMRFNSDDDWDEKGKLKPNAPSYSPFIRHSLELD